jgi:membrane-associated HD superfamily phosphohydrolase
MSSGKKTKKNISNNPAMPPKRTTKDRIKEKIGASNKGIGDDFINSLLGKKEKNNGLSMGNSEVNSNNSRNIKNIKGNNALAKNKKNKILSNFHNAISSTKSDQVIVKMLELNENDIITFYTNLEKLIGKEMSVSIREQMSKDIKSNSKDFNKIALCPFCRENKSNCVILLCGHMICHICAKNINRCKYPCPKCKKPIKYIQYIVD